MFLSIGLTIFLAGPMDSEGLCGSAAQNRTAASHPAVSVGMDRWRTRLAAPGISDFSSFGALVYPEFFSATRNSYDREERHLQRMREAKRRASRIRPGMTRAQIQRIFPMEDGGLSGLGATRYYFDHEVMIEVPYDNNGGHWSLQNRVVGPLRVYRSPFHID